ncbi:MAG: Mut7-C RNAse domain-containing protein [Bacteroidales bacterium]
MTKNVWFRFYEELNDFLPSGKRKVSIPYSFSGRQSVKDAVEALGVPHVEIDLILVNGKSVDFSYLLKNGDRISVYPVFESLDISGVTHLREKPLREIKFVLDVHLGKLARYLRLCGFDTLYEKDYCDNEIITISSLQNRIILTRDKKLLNNKKVTHGIWIRSQYPESQLKEVFDRLDLKYVAKPFTRCMGCNTLLVDVPKEKIIDKLPHKTRELYNTFRLCPQCDQIYWEGSHFKRMKEFISVFTGNK